MKKQVYSLFATAGLVLALAVVSAYGQSTHLIVVSIPFNFVAKDKVLPAGEYTVEAIRVGGSEALKIQSRDGHITAILPARFARVRGNQVEPKLVFSRFGNQYFLSQVLGFEEKSAYRLLKSRMEDELASSERAPKKETVSIAGHHK